MNSSRDVVCLKKLGKEFHNLGLVYLIYCFPQEMVLYGGDIREWFLLRLYSDSLSVKRELASGGAPPWTALWKSVARDLSLPRCKLCSSAWSSSSP